MKVNLQVCILPAVFFLISVNSIISQENAVTMKNQAEFRKQFTEATQKTGSVESNFIQQKSLNVLSEKIISKGKFYFRKSNSLRWEYTDPFSYLIILNNGKILVKDEEKEKQFDAASNKVFREINAVLLGCAQGTLLNDEIRFSATFLETPDAYLVKLKPKEPRLKEIFSEISIFLDKKDFSVNRLIMNEPSGDQTTITFLSKKLNQPIPDEMFRIH